MALSAVVACDRQWCSQCEMWLNGPAQYGEHSNGRKHRKYVKRLARANAGLVDVKRLARKIVVPEGSLLIIEQVAILKDATANYLLSLYARSLLRARL